jgi:hypothetical protein
VEFVLLGKYDESRKQHVRQQDCYWSNGGAALNGMGMGLPDRIL